MKQGVITPDLYKPQLSPVFAAVLAHHGAVADVARVADPNHKGVVEKAIQHTQDIALKGQRFESIEQQNEWLTHSAYVLAEDDRIFNPSRETAHLIAKVHKIGPHCAQLAREIFARLGRPGQKAIYGLANFARSHSVADIERACEQVLRLSRPCYQALKRILSVSAEAKEASAAADKKKRRQEGEHIRQIQEYQRFFDQHADRLSLLSTVTTANPAPPEPTR